MIPADVVIVGAGPVGLFLWEQLSIAGLAVVLLEGGPLKTPDDFTRTGDSPLWEYRASSGAPIEWVRTHAVGGRTLGWGGFGFRFPQTVFAMGGWPYTARTLSRDYAKAEAWLGLVEGEVRPLHRRAANRLGWHIRALRGARRSGRIWTAREAAGVHAAQTHHVGCAFTHDKTHATALRVVNSNGGETLMSARIFIVAAGPIETARLLLASGLKSLAPRLGAGLTDHPMMTYMLFEPKPAPAVLSPYVHLDGALLSDPAGHSIIEVTGPYAPRPEELDDLVDLGLPLRDVASARMTYINGITQTFRNSGRRVTLARDAHDAIGRPIPILHLGTTPRDDRVIRRLHGVCTAFAEGIASPGSELFLMEDAAPTHRLFHEAGICAMGLAAEACCNPFGQLRALDNVWIADASVFPSAGDRHPTLTVLAHASRVARDVIKRLGR